MPTCPSNPWNPDHPSVSLERESRANRVFLLRHDAYPFEASWDEAAGTDALLKCAATYLEAANRRLQIPAALLTSLSNPHCNGLDGTCLRWLLLKGGRRQSYWAGRQSGLDVYPAPSAGPVIDRSAILLAMLASKSDIVRRLFGGQALRVVAHVSAATGGRPVQVRFVGVVSTLPLLAKPALLATQSAHFSRARLGSLNQRIATAFDLPAGTLPFDTGTVVREDIDSSGQPTSDLEFFSKTALSRKSARESVAMTATPYSLRTQFSFLPNWNLTPIAKHPLITFATLDAEADVFTADPASKAGLPGHRRVRPNREVRDLDASKLRVQFGPLPVGGANGMVKLETPDFRVLNSRLTDQPLNEDNTKEVAQVSAAKPRSNEFTAVSAFGHTADLFKRMRRYGLAPAAYFRYFKLPLDVRYRAGIIPGYGDGRLINAQVRFNYLWPCGTYTPQRALELRFALGDLQSAAGNLPADLPSAKEKSPLGVATDPRWCWHEFGHVLSAGAVGELELPFAHSAGDALAAIVNDPDSGFACDRSGVAVNEGGWRGATFPWISIPRRHDREVARGWAWCGSMNQGDPYAPATYSGDRRGYWSEQILSTSLFRLYRAIGGDNCETDANGRLIPARADRRLACDYAVYLIMRAIQTLGPANATPCETARVFVDALCKADTGTAGLPGPGGYVGGTVRKVVQWAFERQGLYGIPTPGATICGADEIARVDLHIDDRRDKRDGPYTPTSLRDHSWHASADAIRVAPPFWPWSTKWKIRIEVLNRGPDDATDTRVDVWAAPLNGDGTAPPFPGQAWIVVGSETNDVRGHRNGEPGARTFGVFKWVPTRAGRYAILAAATCDSDRSNVDPVTGLPCASLATPLDKLIPFDNNLGIALVEVPPH